MELIKKKERTEDRQLTMIQDQIDAYLESLRMIDGEDERAKDIIRTIKTLEEIKKEYVHKPFFDKQSVLELIKVAVCLLQFGITVNDEGFRSFTTAAKQFMINVVPKMKNNSN